MQVLCVSRETTARLEIFVALLRKWNSTVNLVAKSTLNDIDSRHIQDSLQILHHVPDQPDHWLDIGTGGGFPGLVIAAQLATTAPDCRITLLESDQRKAAFLREATRMMQVNATVIAQRIESAPPQNADILSARALAPLPALCGLIVRHMRPTGTAVLLQGKSLSDELRQATAMGWRFDSTHHKSQTDETGVVLVLRNLTLEPTS